MRKLLILTFLIALTLQDSIFHRNLLPSNGQGLCLDGTPGAYYLSQGEGVNKTKFVIHFEGGGWCGSSSLASTIDSCYSRSNGDLGSSKAYNSTLNLVNWGILSGDKVKNPGFYDWTRVFFKYCDGSGHQGTRSQPLNYKDKKLYFRGQNITIGQLQAINQSHHLYTQASQIIVTGGSAGGLAVFLWANYVADHAKGRVVAVPDSGIFLDVQSVKTKAHDYRTRFINLLSISNAEVHTPVTQCNKAYPTQIWRCMFAQNLYKYVKIPLFAVQSLYDSWSAPNILAISCIQNHSLLHCPNASRQSLEVYQKQTRDILHKITGMKGNGAWAPACSDHCYMHSNAWNDKKDFAIPGGSSFTVEQSVLRWFLNVNSPQNHIHIDAKPWPSNTGCAGQTSVQIDTQQKLEQSLQTQ